MGKVRNELAEFAALVEKIAKLGDKCGYAGVDDLQDCARRISKEDRAKAFLMLVDGFETWTVGWDKEVKKRPDAFHFPSNDCAWRALEAAMVLLCRSRFGFDEEVWVRVLTVLAPVGWAGMRSDVLMGVVYRVLEKDLQKGLQITPRMRETMLLAVPHLMQLANAAPQRMALRIRTMVRESEESAAKVKGESAPMAKKTKDVVATIDEKAAQKFIDDFVQAADPDAYSAAHIGAADEIQRILSLNEADQRMVVAALSAVIKELHGRNDAALAKNQVVSASKSPWLRERGIAKSILMERLLKRKHDFNAQEIVGLIGSMGSNGDYVWSSYTPGVVAAVERFAASGPLPTDVAAVIGEFHKKMRIAGGNANRLLADRIGKCLLDDTSGAEQPPQEPTAAERVLLNRADIADEGPWLLDAMAAALVLPPETERMGAAQFGPVNHPCVSEAVRVHINEMLDAARGTYSGRDKESKHVASLLELMINEKGPGVATGTAALTALSLDAIEFNTNSERAMRFHNGFSGLLNALTDALNSVQSANAASLGEVCHALSKFRKQEFLYPQWTMLAEAVARLARGIVQSLEDVHLLRIIRFRERVSRTEGAHDRSGVQDLDRALGIDKTYGVELGDRWSDRMVKDLHAMSAARRGAWMRAIEHGKACKGSAPSAKWIKGSEAVLKDLPREHFEEMLNTWFPLVGKPRPSMAGGKISGRDSTVPTESGADVLRALAMMAGRVDTPGSARALGDLAMACFKMVPGVGARCIRPGTAALHGLSGMSTPAALSQLSRLRQLVKFGTAKKMLDTSLERLATQLGVTTSELHEMAAPDFGLDGEGRIAEEAGDFTLELVAGTGGAEVRVLDAKGTVRKSVPDVVKKEHGESLKALKQAQGDIDKMLEAQRARIDSMFVEDRRWTVPQWRERYITHPLMGVLGRRLIWRIVDDPKSADLGRAVLWRDDRKAFVDQDGAEVTPQEQQHARLWHPIHATQDEVRRWRDIVEQSGHRQPVKQAHREVYPLTDAERATGTYSNRFAAHVLKQHAFQKLAAERGWTSKLRLMVDAEYPPPTRELLGWGMRAEFWIESIGDNYGTDTTESGSYLYIATDQVRFYRQRAARAYAHAGGGGYAVHAEERPENLPLPLTEVPALVLSEMLRDVDLFVAEASVGNNPQWQDGGPDGRFQTYWQAYSFGELSGSGKSRRELLQRLVPRLRIANVCEMTGDFLRVRGKLRTYKIHLGSGNILMEPNDQYLCIVPSSGVIHSEGDVFLPFEGDRTLAIILSKAFMLADDDKIKDKSILTQIDRK